MTYGAYDWFHVARSTRKSGRYAQRLVDNRKNFAMESKEQEDKPEDIRIWTSTFASKQDEHVTDQGNGKEMSRSTPKEPTALIGSKVSPFPIVLSEEPLFDLKEVDTLLSDTNIVEHDAGKTRSRTLTSKGREYQCELKKKAA